MVSRVTRKPYRVTRGPAYAPSRVKKAADFDVEMLASGAWKSVEFKPYNFATLGLPVGGGYFHPLLKVRAEFRKILLAMGFEEMPTNRWVESSFWNFDTLFQPQSHPARDAHDTFFLKVRGVGAIAHKKTSMGWRFVDRRPAIDLDSSSDRRDA